MDVLGNLRILCGDGSEVAGDENVLNGCREVPRKTKYPIKRMRKCVYMRATSLRILVPCNRPDRRGLGAPAG
jgi:hypothetical protein